MCEPGGAAGVSHDSPRIPNVHISGFRSSKTPTKFNERAQERHKKNEMVAGKGRKRAKFWAVRRKAVRRSPNPQPQNNNNDNKHNTTTTTTTTTKIGQNTKTLKLAKVGLAKVGQHSKTLKLAKVGLAKVGHDLSSRGLSSGGGFTAGRGGPAEGSIGNGQFSGFRVQFRFFGTKTETEQKLKEERDE